MQWIIVIIIIIIQSDWIKYFNPRMTHDLGYIYYQNESTNIFQKMYSQTRSIHAQRIVFSSISNFQFIPIEIMSWCRFLMFNK